MYAGPGGGVGLGEGVGRGVGVGLGVGDGLGAGVNVDSGKSVAYTTGSSSDKSVLCWQPVVSIANSTIIKVIQVRFIIVLPLCPAIDYRPYILSFKVFLLRSA